MLLNNRIIGCLILVCLLKWFINCVNVFLFIYFLGVYVIWDFLIDLFGGLYFFGFGLLGYIKCGCIIWFVVIL